MQLKNKIALVTGASSGIGKAIAEKFASEGALVILTSRNLDRLKEVENSIKKNNGKADSIVMDVTDREQVKNAVLGIIEKYKKIDVLVNNAGIARWGPIEDVSYEDFDEQIKFNLTGSFNTIKEIAPIMIEQKSGSIVNIITRN